MHGYVSWVLPAHVEIQIQSSLASGYPQHLSRCWLASLGSQSEASLGCQSES